MRALERFLSVTTVTAALAFAAAVGLSGCEEDPVQGTVFSPCKVDEQCRGGMKCKACGCYPADQECPVPDAGGGDGSPDAVTDGVADAPADGGADTGVDAGADTGTDTGTDAGAEGGLDAADAPGDG